jgi:hypothetical protein
MLPSCRRVVVSGVQDSTDSSGLEEEALAFRSMNDRDRCCCFLEVVRIEESGQAAGSYFRVRRPMSTKQNAKSKKKKTGPNKKGHLCGRRTDASNSDSQPNQMELNPFQVWTKALEMLVWLTKLEEDFISSSTQSLQ